MGVTEEGTSYNDPVKRKEKARKISFVLTR